tara:strand:+ start:4719 stop:5129 length:411 start_codon:yes stop_codon:yes gene_type:complete
MCVIAAALIPVRLIGARRSDLARQFRSAGVAAARRRRSQPRDPEAIVDGVPFEVADQRSIALSLAPGPIVDPDDAQFKSHGPRTRRSPAEEGILAHVEPHPASKCLGRTIARGGTKVGDEVLKATGPAAMTISEAI